GLLEGPVQERLGLAERGVRLRLALQPGDKLVHRTFQRPAVGKLFQRWPRSPLFRPPAACFSLLPGHRTPPRNGSPTLGGVELAALVPLVLLDSRIPLGEVTIGNQVLVLLRDEQARLLEGVDEGRVQSRRLHVLDHHRLQVFRVWHVGEEGVARPRLPAVPGDERLPKLLQRLPHFGRHGRGPENGARLVLDRPSFLPAPQPGGVRLECFGNLIRIRYDSCTLYSRAPPRRRPCWSLRMTGSSASCWG